MKTSELLAGYDDEGLRRRIVDCWCISENKVMGIANARYSPAGVPEVLLGEVWKPADDVAFFPSAWGYVNSRDSGAWLVSRTPQRATTFGINQRGANARSVDTSAVTPLTVTMFREIMNPTYPNGKTALHKLLSGKRAYKSLAISRDVVLSVTPRGVQLLHSGTSVGIISVKDKQLLLTTDLPDTWNRIKEEVCPLFN